MKLSVSRLGTVLGLVVVLSFLALALASSPAGAATRIDRPALAAPAWFGYGCLYRVGYGDTMYGMSRYYGLSPYAMMAANGLYSSNYLYAGMMLRVPCRVSIYAVQYNTTIIYSPARYSSANYSICAYHLVRPGEYLLLIAARYRTSWRALAVANYLYNPNLIFAGTRLVIPCARAYNASYPSRNPYSTGGSNPYAAPGTGGYQNPAPAPQSPSATIMDFMFMPARITIHAGQTVVWTNNGPSMHTVTSDTGLFDSGSLGVGATYPHTFATVGTYAYHCSIHPMMRGTVVVIP